MRPRIGIILIDASMQFLHQNTMTACNHRQRSIGLNIQQSVEVAPFVYHKTTIRRQAWRAFANPQKREKFQCYQLNKIESICFSTYCPRSARGVLIACLVGIFQVHIIDRSE
jgi:hypothetical protein